MKLLRLTVFIFCFFTALFGSAQNETTKWYFGFYAGLDFSSGAPVSVISPSMYAAENAASMADAAGNLLFYSNSETIWNRNHDIMANGSGILGNWSTTQCIVLKQPGSSSIYNLFTGDDAGGPDGIRYSTIDMTLAAGMGSVTAKNVLLYTPSSEKISAVLHCNGTDIWVLSHDRNGNGFRAYLVTSSGVNLTPVITNIGTNYQGTAWAGFIKFSPNGRKLAVSIPEWQSPYYELYDFDNSTGILSGPQTLTVSNSVSLGACEFSPDGTKLYAIVSLSSTVVQWDLCAGNATTVVQSQFSGLNNYFGALQTGPDKKIYVARANNPTLGVINNPNAAGTAFNYTDFGPTLAANGLIQPLNALGLPSFLPHFFRQAPSFTYTATCQNASFTAPSQFCSASGASFTSLSWDFGDPASGSANISTAYYPMHAYATSGSFTAQLILYYPCSTDTVKVPITITNSAPSLSITGPLSICRGQTNTYTVNGTGNYSWSNGATGNTAVLSPTFSTIYTITGTDPVSGCSNSKTFTVAVSPCTGITQNNSGNTLLMIYPNPGQHHITIETTTGGSLIVYDLPGKVIDQKLLDPGKNQLEISDLNNGLYFFKFSDGARESTARFIKTD